jgi:Domain of unknown function (DUF4157)
MINEQLQAQAQAPAKSSFTSAPRGLLQRKCACGGTPDPTGECDACRKKRLQRKGRNSDTSTQPSTFNSQRSDVPPIVYEVLRSPGQPLDAASRHFMESRFRFSFGEVRVHADQRAAESARALNALAYTVGRDVVFGTGQYAPQFHFGRKLIAHELAHVMQQKKHAQKPEKLELGRADDAHEHQALSIERGMEHPAIEGNGPRGSGNLSSRASESPAGVLQRACLTAAECAGTRSTLTEFVAETEKKPENISKADKRKKACTKVPRDASCTSDGHGASATALTNILKAKYASRLGFITGIFVNKDIPATWGAVTNDCADFMPPLPGGKCTFVPDTLEAQGKQFQSGNKTVGGQPRQDWLTDTIGTLSHETEHARFDVAAPIAAPGPAACKFADHESNLSEVAARLSEMHVEFRAALARPGDKNRYTHFHNKFNDWVQGGSEDISDTVKDLRCKCECADADYFITKTVESVSANQKWNNFERTMIHNELRDPKWKLKWPVAPPGSVDVGDLPSKAAAPLKFE